MVVYCYISGTKNDTMAKISSAIRKEQVGRDGKVNIKIRIFHNGKKGYLKTRFNVLPNQFEKGRVKKSHKLYSFINKELKILEADVETQILNIPNADKLSCAKLMAELKKDDDAVNFLNEISKHIESIIPDDPKNGSSTWEKYYYTRVNVKYFMGFDDPLPEDFKRYEFKVGIINEPFVGFSEIDTDFLDDFVDWHLEKGNSLNGYFGQTVPHISVETVPL